MNRPILPYMDFSGGLNFEMSNEKLKDNEFTILQNADINTRGSVKRRTGRTKLGTIPGTGQGLFFFYRGQDEPDLIGAISGKLYVKPYGSSTFTQIVIYDASNNVFTFQDTLSIEAVQYRDTLFVATGTKLVEVTYDTTANQHKASVMVAYKPTVDEVINIGTNAIADDPATWIQEKEAATVTIEGITSSVPQGAANAAVTFTAHVEKPASINVNYSFSWRKTGAGNYNYVTSNSPNNYADITFQDIGGYDIQVETKKVIYPIDTWSSNNDGWVNGIQGNQWDSADNNGCLILQGTTPCPEDASLLSWKDLGTPLDMTNANTIDWWFTTYSQSTQSGYDAGAVFIKFYTQGNLTTPILTINNQAGVGSGRGVGGSWVHEANMSYDNTIAGLDKIVRIGVGGPCVAQNGNYIAGNGSWTISSSDTTTRFDTIQIWESGTETSYVKSNFQVVGVIDPTIDPEAYSAIHTSRMIRLHWDRLILGKDNKYPGQLYISDLNNPRYFPTNKRIDFSLDRMEPITSVVRYQGFLVVFTKTTISTLTGTHPQDGNVTDGNEYKVSLINDTLGCIADRSAKVVTNNIYFLSADGLHALVPNPYQLQNLEPQRIDFPIKSGITIDPAACAVVHNEQYFLCLPSQRKIYRHYFNINAWAEDVSSKLNLAQYAYYNGVVYELSQDGNVYVHDDSVWSDDGEVYDMVVQSKYIDLQSVFNYKRLKRLFVLAKYYEDHTVSLYNRVWADSQIVLDPTTGEMVTGTDGITRWVTTTLANMHMYGSTEMGFWTMGQGTFGEPSIFINESQIRGKCHRVRVSFTHSDDCECEILGFGFEFKYKSPGRMVNT